MQKDKSKSNNQNKIHTVEKYIVQSKGIGKIKAGEKPEKINIAKKNVQKKIKEVKLDIFA